MTRALQILLVDDEVAIQRAVTPLLRSQGYEVEIAGTARDALSAFERMRPDLIVLDLGLPDADGLTVCRRIRAESDVPILVLSARGAEKEKVLALDQGADDFVTKPFGPDELLARIRTVLRRALRTGEPGTGRLEVGDLVID
jgi:two-component system, OmpR family, KDP operon response regulator KdpE